MVLGGCVVGFTFELCHGRGDKPPRREAFVVSNMDKWQQRIKQALGWMDGWRDRCTGLCFTTTSCASLILLRDRCADGCNHTRPSGRPNMEAV